jgi:uridine kinase
MLNDLITITPRHENAARMVLDRILELRAETPKEKMIITVSGEVGTGKSTVSTALGLMLKKRDIRSKIMDLDDYYKIPPLERRKWRLENGIDSIGYDEYDWDRVQQNISDFQESKVSVMPCVDLITRYTDELTTNFEGVDMLIINGLYSLKIDNADLKVFIEMTYDETKDAQKYSQKENFDAYRLQIMQREHEVVQGLKSNAEYFVDFDNSLYHL